MAQQMTMNFDSQSPINWEKLTGQNRILYDYLSQGNTITMFEAPLIGVGYLNSRISDLKNEHDIQIFKRYIKRRGIVVREYSLKPFND